MLGDSILAMACILINGCKNFVMQLKEIQSKTDLLQNLQEESKSYLLLYKKGSEQSDCAYKHISELKNDFRELKIMTADVNEVRDIHKEYNITTVPSLIVFDGKEFKNVIKGCSTSDYYRSLFESSLFMAKQNDGEPQKSVIVYSTPTCSWCNTLKSYLRKNGVYFTDIDVSADPALAEELVRKSGQQGVPQTEIDGEIIVGFDKTRINKLLGIGA